MRTTCTAIAISFSMMLLAPSLTLANKSDGSRLLEECTLAAKVADDKELSSIQYIYATRCVGLVKGTAYAMARYSKETCLPDVYETATIVRAIVLYLNKHPEKFHLDERELVISAINDVYHCE